MAKADKRMVTIFATEDDDTDVFLAVNGRAVQVQRNAPVPLGEEYIEVLKNSKITTFSKDPATGKEVPMTVPRYNYSVE